MSVRFKTRLDSYVRGADINRLLDAIEDELEPAMTQIVKALHARIDALEAETKRLNRELETERRLRLGGRR
jgi:hypothetical protein